MNYHVCVNGVYFPLVQNYLALVSLYTYVSYSSYFRYYYFHTIHTFQEYFPETIY